jgi:CBS domain-containing protein
MSSPLFQVSIVLEFQGNLSPQSRRLFSNNGNMKNELVKKYMTQDPIVIGPETTLPEAHQLMKAAGVRRLPVVSQGVLVGLITLEDIRDASPNDPTSLSIYELNYELASLLVKEVMTPDPVSISISATIREASNLMLAHGISGLPVLEGSKLVGIITESDIFRLLVTDSSLT